jgi:hypothetical protein
MPLEPRPLPPQISERVLERRHAIDRHGVARQACTTCRPRLSPRPSTASHRRYHSPRPTLRRHAHLARRLRYGLIQASYGAAAVHIMFWPLFPRAPFNQSQWVSYQHGPMPRTTHPRPSRMTRYHQSAFRLCRLASARVRPFCSTLGSKPFKACQWVSCHTRLIYVLSRGCQAPQQLFLLLPTT